MTKTQPWSFIKQALTLLVMVAVFLIIERQVNIFLGKQAIKNNDLGVHSFEQALSIAQLENKPILANFSALWCGACRAMEKSVLSQAKVQKQLRTNVVYVRLEETEQKHQSLFLKYRITQYPTLLLLDPKGTIIDDIGYVQKEDELLSRLLKHDQ